MRQIHYNRKEKQFCPNCDKEQNHLASQEPFDGDIMGYICTNCGAVWHFDGLGQPCIHGYIPQTQVMMAEKLPDPVLEKMLQSFLEFDREFVKTLEHETKMWDTYRRLE